MRIVLSRLKSLPLGLHTDICMMLGESLYDDDFATSSGGTLMLYSSLCFLGLSYLGMKHVLTIHLGVGTPRNDSDADADGSTLVYFNNGSREFHIEPFRIPCNIMSHLTSGKTRYIL